jgi:hypothetical protein
VLLDTAARFRSEIEADHAMAAAQQPLRHIGAHAPKPDHADFHQKLSSLSG